jgi:hypothetical protein
MTDIRFIRKDGQKVNTAIVRKRFFETVLESGGGSRSRGKNLE